MFVKAFKSCSVEDDEDINYIMERLGGILSIIFTTVTEFTIKLAQLKQKKLNIKGLALKQLQY